MMPPSPFVVGDPPGSWLELEARARGTPSAGSPPP